MTTINPFTSSGRNKIQASARTRLPEKSPLAFKATEKSANRKILDYIVSEIKKADESGNIELKFNLIDQVDKNGNTPLHRAAGQGDIKTVKFLINAGANLSIENKDGITPQDIAQKIGNSDIEKILNDPFSIFESKYLDDTVSETESSDGSQNI